MIKATLFVDRPYLDNRIFDENNTVLNRDNCLEGFRLLRTKFAVMGIELATQDINPVSLSSFTVYNDVPAFFPDDHDTETSILLLFESVVIKPQNWMRKTHAKFKYILTWNDPYVDEVKYFKFFFSQPDLSASEDSVPFAEKKMCVLIAANKVSPHKLELYSERAKAIKWFESNHPDEFDLYGPGWDKGIERYSSKFMRRLYRKIPLLKPSVFFPVKCYRGMAEKKSSVLRNYRYAICYENARGIPGYITEKIFDCFVAGTVPVYLGPPNADKFIPHNCYIDKNDFPDYDSLYSHLRKTTETGYQRYQDNIRLFLNSPQASVFSNSYFVQQICNVVDNFLNAKRVNP